MPDEIPAKPNLNDRTSAAHIIAGYRYQLLHSVAAWLALRQEDELWLELSEDFSIETPGGRTDVQVKGSQAKAGPASFSLNSSAVFETLNRFWNRAAPIGSLKMVFLARGAAARENGFSFPNDIPGLIYWSRAAGDADTAPIRRALLEIFRDTALGKWLAEGPTDAELRRRLLTPVIWQLEEQSSDAIAGQIVDITAGVLLERGLPVRAAEQIVRMLVDEAFEAAAKPNPNDRKLRLLDLHRKIEDWVVNANLITSMGEAKQTSTSLSVLVSELPSLLSAVSEREETVQGIRSKCMGEPLIWLHGSSGAGKSYLARLLANRISGRWITLDLRQLQNDDTGALAAWRDLTRTMSTGISAAGVIIDDFNFDGSSILWSRLTGLIQVLIPTGAKVIVTSARAPSPARLLPMGCDSASVCQAPYFTVDEVTDLVSAGTAPDTHTVSQWAHLIWMTTSGGHPTLTAAKISSLRARRWPETALAEDLGNVSEAVSLSRTDARRILIRDLSSSGGINIQVAGQLLRRLASVYDRFDDGLAFKLMTSSPGLENAGDSLTLLKGGWLEALPNGESRVSPLINDIANDSDPSDVKKWRQVAAEYWAGQKTLDAHTLPLCFWNAFWGEHTAVLGDLSRTLMTLSEEKIAGAAPLLSPLTAFQTNAPIYKADAFVSVSLRMLQFLVADIVGISERAAEIARQMLVEVSEFEIESVRILMSAYAFPKVLMAANCHLSMKERVTLPLKVRSIYATLRELGEAAIPDPVSILANEFPDIDFASFLFCNMMQHMDGSQDFLEVISALNELEPDDRNTFVDAVSKIHNGPGIFVCSGWSKDQTSDRDMVFALENYIKAESIVSNWGREDMMVEFAVSRSVIYDECILDRNLAISAIDEAMSVHGVVTALIRQKSKVLGHLGRDDEAADLLLAIEDTVGVEAFDRGLALRDGAISAYRAGRPTDAIRLFQKAQASLRRTKTQNALALGIAVEQALISWLAGDRRDALNQTADILVELDCLAVDESAQAERTHRAVRILIGVFRSQLRDATGPKLSVGEASVLEGGDAQLTGEPISEIKFQWRLLVNIEATMSDHTEISDRADKLGFTQGFLVLESLTFLIRIGRTLLSGDVRASLEGGFRVAAVTKYVVSRVGSGSQELIDQQSLRRWSIESWLQEPDNADAISTVLVDVSTVALSKHNLTPRFISELRTTAEQTLVPPDVIRKICSALSYPNPVPLSASMSEVGAQAIAVPSSVVAGEPYIRFHRDLMLVGYMTNSFQRHVVAPLLLPTITDGWKLAIETQRFRLSNPGKNVPVIEAALSFERANELKHCANLLLAVAPALPDALSENWHAFLTNIVKA